MRVIERIRSICREKKNISITTLEKTLGYSNGSLAKAKVIPSSRIMEIADFLDVSADFLLTGKEKEDAPIFNKDHVELIGMYSRLNETQKKAVFDLLRSFLEN